MAVISKNTATTASKTPVDTQSKAVTGDTKKTTASVAKIGDNVKVEYVAKIGDTTYRLSKGEILVQPIPPEVRCSTRRFSQARLVVLDPNATLFSQFRKESEVTVSIGYEGGKVVEKFKGKIKNVGRVEPLGTLIIAIDNLAQLGNSAAAGTSDAGVVPAADGRKTDLDRSKRKVSKTLSYAKIDKTKITKGTKLKDNTSYDPTAVLVFSTSIPEKSTVTISIPGATEFVDAIVASGAGGATGTLTLSEGAYTKVAALANKDKKPFKLEIYTLPTETTNAATASTAEQAVLGSTNLKYAKQTPSSPKNDGGSTLQQTAGQKIVKDAAMKGDVVIAQGNTIKEVSADQANQTKTALILDYKNGRPAFLGEPILTVKTPLVVNSGVGTLTVNGWNVNTKEAISATASTPPGSSTTLADLKVFASPKGPLKTGDPIYPGSAYTWGDATKGGTRIPHAPEVYQGIIKIAQVITALTEQTVGKGKKWQINSWYRDPAYNARISSSGRSGPHTHGSAVDFIFQPYDACIKLFKQYKDSHPFGVACHPNLFQKNGQGFVHLDLIEVPKGRRWSYQKGGQAIEDAYFRAHPNG